MIIFRDLWLSLFHTAALTKPLCSSNLQLPPQTHCIWILYRQSHSSSFNSPALTLLYTASADLFHSSIWLFLPLDIQCPTDETLTPSVLLHSHRGLTSFPNSCFQVVLLYPTRPSWHWWQPHLTSRKNSREQCLSITAEGGDETPKSQSAQECSGERVRVERVSHKLIA